VFTQALQKGFGAFAKALADDDAVAAIKLTLLVAAIAVPVNLLFGLAASWSIAKFSFPGKSLLITLIDLPFSVSPVVSGLVYVLVFGSQGVFGDWLAAHDIEISRRSRHRSGDDIRDLPVHRARANSLMQEQGTVEEERR